MNKKLKIILIVILIISILMSILYAIDFIRFINDEKPILYQIHVKYRTKIVEINHINSPYSPIIIAERITERKKELKRERIAIAITNDIKLEYKWKEISILDFSIGDDIEVSYSGMIDECYPATLLDVSKIKIIKKHN